MTEFNLEQIKNDMYVDAIKLRLEGFTFFDISKKLNISAATVRNYVYKGASIVDDPLLDNELALVSKRNTKQVYSKRVMQDIVSMRLKGSTYKEIGKELDVSPAAVGAFVKDYTSNSASKKEKEKLLNITKNNFRGNPSEDKIDRAFKLRMKGHTYSRIAEIMGISYYAARSYVKRAEKAKNDKELSEKLKKIKFDNHGWHTEKEETSIIKKIIDLRLKRLSYSEISSQVDVSASTVGVWIRRYIEETDDQKEREELIEVRQILYK